MWCAGFGASSNQVGIFCSTANYVSASCTARLTFHNVVVHLCVSFGLVGNSCFHKLLYLNRAVCGGCTIGAPSVHLIYHIL